MYYGLGGAVGDSLRRMTFEEAKAALGGAGMVGVPYDGTATTSDGIAVVWETLVPIANGDVSAMLANLANPDPYIARIAFDSLKRAIANANPEQFVTGYHIDGDMFQRLTGRSMYDEPWWRFRRENQILATVFPYMGGRGGVIQGSDHKIHVHYDGPVLGPDQSVYDPNYDFAALAAAAKAWAEANPGDAPTQEAIARTQAEATPAAPSGPPAGWHYNGVDGWWGPDGRFYKASADATPWDGSVPGVDVNAENQKAIEKAAADAAAAAAAAATSATTPVTAPPEVVYGPSSQVLPPSSGAAAQQLVQSFQPGAMPVLMAAGSEGGAAGGITPAPGGMDQFLAMLNRRVAGIPVWGWGLAIGVGVGLLARRKRK